MLIIFDLDDTLVQTSRYLTIDRLKKIFESLPLDQEAFHDLLSINQKALSAKKALEIFYQKYCLEGLETAHEILSSPFEGDFLLPETEGAKDLLTSLSEQHILALVTQGNPVFQRQKLEKAGIEPGLFSTLYVGDGLGKKSLYQSLLDEYHLTPDMALVVGDRIEIDLTPAKELGITTVHFKHGRGAFLPGRQEDVDREINKIGELEGIIYERCQSSHK